MAKKPKIETSGMGLSAQAPCSEFPPAWLEQARLAAHTYAHDQKYLALRKKLTLKTVGAELRRGREATGVSVREMGRRLGCSAVFVSDVERGNRMVNLQWINRYAALLNFPNDKVSNPHP